MCDSDDRCVFCAIVRGQAPASIVHDEDDAIAFLTLSQVREGECVVIPKRHIDHFLDVPETLAARLFVLAQRIGRVLQAEFEPKRMGLVIHGFGVPHTHLILLPQHTIHDITSIRYLVDQSGKARFSQAAIPPTAREELDRRAARIRAQLFDRVWVVEQPRGMEAS